MTSCAPSGDVSPGPAERTPALLAIGAPRSEALASLHGISARSPAAANDPWVSSSKPPDVVAWAPAAGSREMERTAMRRCRRRCMLPQSACGAKVTAARSRPAAPGCPASGVPAPDGARELQLGHARATRDLQDPGTLVELGLGEAVLAERGAARGLAPLGPPAPEPHDAHHALGRKHPTLVRGREARSPRAARHGLVMSFT